MNGSMLFYLLILVAVYMTFRNFQMVSRGKHNKGYVDGATAIFRHDADAYQIITDYLSKETAEEHLNKARILKLYVDLDKGYDAQNTLDSFDPSKLFFNKKGVLDTKMVEMNSDSFVWAILALIKAKGTGNEEVLNAFYEKFMPFAEVLNDQMEFQLMKNVVDALEEKEDKGIPFFKELNFGTYSGLYYDKRLVGMYKRIAAFFLSEAGEELDDFLKEDLSAFAESSVGHLLMSDLGVYEKYHVEPPVEEETPAEETAEAAEALEASAEETIAAEAEAAAEAEEAVEETVEAAEETAEDAAEEVTEETETKEE